MLLNILQFTGQSVPYIKKMTQHKISLMLLLRNPKLSRPWCVSQLFTTVTSARDKSIYIEKRFTLVHSVRGFSLWLGGSPWW